MFFPRANFGSMPSQGERLRSYFRNEGVKLVTAAKKLEIHVNTLQNWLHSEELDISVFARLGKHWPNIMEEFPEVEWRKVPSETIDPSAFYLNQADAACREQLASLNNRYINLLERHNELLEKHLLLQEKLIDS